MMRYRSYPYIILHSIIWCRLNSTPNFGEMIQSEAGLKPPASVEWWQTIAWKRRTSCKAKAKEIDGVERALENQYLTSKAAGFWIQRIIASNSSSHKHTPLLWGVGWMFFLVKPVVPRSTSPSSRAGSLESFHFVGRASSVGWSCHQKRFRRWKIRPGKTGSQSGVRLGTWGKGWVEKPWKLCWNSLCGFFFWFLKATGN